LKFRENISKMNITVKTGENLVTKKIRNIQDVAVKEDTLNILSQNMV